MKKNETSTPAKKSTYFVRLQQKRQNTARNSKIIAELLRKHGGKEGYELK